MSFDSLLSEQKTESRTTTKRKTKIKQRKTEYHIRKGKDKETAVDLIRLEGREDKTIVELPIDTHPHVFLLNSLDQLRHVFLPIDLEIRIPSPVVIQNTTNPDVSPIIAFKIVGAAVPIKYN